MGNQELLDQFDLQQRIEIEFPDADKETLLYGGYPSIVRFLRPDPGMKFILYSRLEPGQVDAAIEAQIEYFSDLKAPFTWNVMEHDQPPGMKERLLAHGFEPDDPGAVMVLDLQEAPQELLQPVTADIQPITQRDQLKDVIQVMEAVWGGNFNWMYNRLGGHLDIPGYLSIYVAYINGQPTSAGWTYFYPKSQFAGLFGGSTLAGFRKRGLYTAILALRVQEAIRRGYRYLAIDASPMSQPIVAKHRFELISHAQDFIWQYRPG